MSRITDLFYHKAFIPFITAGDPNLDITETLILEMANAGADLIEIGIPFSDPVGEGIVIQNSNERSLKAGTTTDKIFDMVKKVHEKTEIPLAFMTYINPIYTYGIELFFKNCHIAKIDAVIVPDLPFEEKEEINSICKSYDIELISLIAPTSHDRIEKIVKEATGFIYCISSIGVTGIREEITTNLKEIIHNIKKVKQIPCAIGFGIATPQQARDIAEISDGIIVGSAIVKIIEQYGCDCIDKVIEYVNSMIEAIR